MTPYEEAFQGKRVLVTGGLGFIGSNLSVRLVELGAKVTIVDNMMPRLGGNLFNVKEIMDHIQINFSDVRDEHSMDYLVKDQDFIFHLAGQVNHVDSIRNPIQDLDINCRGTLVLLESCRKYNREVKVIFSGTRGEYGASVKLPVAEDHPTNPKGIYAVTNLSAEKMVLVYDDVHKISGTCLRITNTYGPRHQMAHDEYGVLNWFIRKAIDDELIPVFGDGHILRDFLYVDDLVECFLQVAICSSAYGEVFNVGTGIPINFIDLAKKIVEVAGSGKVAFTEFTKERKEVEPGDYYTDISKVRKVVGWTPKTD
ncbi:MAG: GDP-mannose 4,6-dehydratase, partial [Deltaproteobacteria bacterium]|nr:GDP-mannose 4,6-dehydratase [Deltaproteobacteria bacterium]